MSELGLGPVGKCGPANQLIAASIVRRSTAALVALADLSQGLALQDELLALKRQVGSLRLKKAAPGSSPSAPFPITATGEVELPPEAGRYDVEGITVSTMFWRKRFASGRVRVRSELHCGLGCREPAANYVLVEHCCHGGHCCAGIIYTWQFTSRE